MKARSGVHPFLERALSEHDELHHVVEKLQDWLHAEPAAEVTCEMVAQARDRLASLRGMIGKHFAQEEEGGYLEEAISHAPALAAPAAGLQRQHAELLRLADRMLRQANENYPPDVAWASMQTSLDQFAVKLLSHEAAENMLLGRAFNEDLGLTD